MSRRRGGGPLDLWFASARLGQELAVMNAEAGLVMARRLTNIALEGANPSAAGRREAETMITEKLLAAYDGAAAAGRAAMRAGLGGSLHTPETALRIADAATRPTRRRVTANAARLRGRP